MNVSKIKTKLKEWMINQTKLLKANNKELSYDEIIMLWKLQYGINVTKSWVIKSLYGGLK